MLAGSAYMAGPDLTLCDIRIGVHAHRWFSFEGIDRPSCPTCARGTTVCSRARRSGPMWPGR